MTSSAKFIVNPMWMGRILGGVWDVCGDGQAVCSEVCLCFIGRNSEVPFYRSPTHCLHQRKTNKQQQKYKVSLIDNLGWVLWGKLTGHIPGQWGLPLLGIYLFLHWGSASWCLTSHMPEANPQARDSREPDFSHRYSKKKSRRNGLPFTLFSNSSIFSFFHTDQDI